MLAPQVAAITLSRFEASTTSRACAPTSHRRERARERAPAGRGALPLLRCGFGAVDRALRESVARALYQKTPHEMSVSSARPQPPLVRYAESEYWEERYASEQGHFEWCVALCGGTRAGPAQQRGPLPPPPPSRRRSPPAHTTHPTTQNEKVCRLRVAAAARAPRAQPQPPRAARRLRVERRAGRDGGRWLHGRQRAPSMH